MCVIIFMMFTSAASGYAACMAFCRGLAGRPFAILQGYGENYHQNPDSGGIFNGTSLSRPGYASDAGRQSDGRNHRRKISGYCRGPGSGLESIKHLGTNGGGFFGANSSTPFENPTVISNIVEMVSMMILPGSCCRHLWTDAPRQKGREKTSVWKTGSRDFRRDGHYFPDWPGCLLQRGESRKSGGWIHGTQPGYGQHGGKGNTFRHGTVGPFHHSDYLVYHGTVNNMHDSLTPLGGLVPLLHMMLNCVFGGKA